MISFTVRAGLMPSALLITELACLPGRTEVAANSPLFSAFESPLKEWWASQYATLAE